MEKLILAALVIIFLTIGLCSLDSEPEYRVCSKPTNPNLRTPKIILEKYWCGAPMEDKELAQAWADYGNKEYPEISHWVEQI